MEKNKKIVVGKKLCSVKGRNRERGIRGREFGEDMGIRGRARAIRIRDFNSMVTVTSGNASPHEEEGRRKKGRKGKLCKTEDENGRCVFVNENGGRERKERIIVGLFHCTKNDQNQLKGFE